MTSNHFRAKPIPMALAFFSTSCLCHLLGLWPFGRISFPAVLIVFFCALGLNQLYAALLDGLRTWATSKRSARPH